MAFKVVSSNELSKKRFGWKCEFWDADESGRQLLQSFRAVFVVGEKADDDAALKDWQERVNAAGGDATKAGKTYDQGWLERHLVDLKEVTDLEGKPYDFEEAFNVVAAYDPARNAVIQGFHAALSGRRKNA